MQNIKLIFTHTEPVSGKDETLWKKSSHLKNWINLHIVT